VLAEIRVDNHSFFAVLANIENLKNLFY